MCCFYIFHNIITVSTTGKSLTVKPSKIVAGQEPEKTNELLQCLAFALDNKLSSDEAVKLYKESINSNKSVENKTKDSVIKSVKKTTETKKLTSRSSEKLTKNDKSNNSIKSKQKQINNIRKESPPKKASQLSKPINKQSLVNKEKQDIRNDTQKKVANNNKEPELNSEKSVVAEPTIDNSKSDHAKANDSPTVSTVNDLEKHIEDTNNIDDRPDPHVEENKSPEEKTETLIPEPTDNIENINSANKEDIAINNNLEQSDIQDHQKSTSKNEDEKLQSNNEKIVSPGNDIQPLQTKVKELVNVVRPQSVRPSSSRPSAPRLKEKHESLIPSADNLAVGKVNIIAENAMHEEVFITNFVYLLRISYNIYLQIIA